MGRAITIPPIGVPTQQANTFPSPPRLIWLFKIPTPIIAPTTAWDVDTGKPRKVIIVTVTAAATDEITACSRVMLGQAAESFYARPA